MRSSQQFYCDICRKEIKDEPFGPMVVHIWAPKLSDLMVVWDFCSVECAKDGMEKTPKAFE